MPPLRQPFDAGGNHFSFATPISTKKSHDAGGEAATEHGTRTVRVKGSHGYFSRPNDLKPGAWAWGNAGNRRDLSLLDGEELNRLTEPEEEDHLGDADASPILLGKARPPRLVPIYPSSQAQIIANYRQEMMELVRGVPETAYELSLRDLVEVRRKATQEEEEENGRKERGAAPVAVSGRESKKKKKVNSGKKQILRSTSMDSGVFLLKMFFPPSLWGRRKLDVAGSGSKVSPKPVPADGEKGRQAKKVGAEWLEGFGDGELSSSGSSNSSGQRRKSIGCYPFSINIGKIR